MLWSVSHPNLAREKVKCFPSTFCRKPCHHTSEKFNYPVVSSPVLTPCSCPSPIPFPHNVVYWVICVIVPVRKALKIVHLIQHGALNCSLGWGQLGESGPASQGMDGSLPGERIQECRGSITLGAHRANPPHYTGRILQPSKAQEGSTGSGLPAPFLPPHLPKAQVLRVRTLWLLRTGWGDPEARTTVCPAVGKDATYRSPPARQRASLQEGF